MLANDRVMITGATGLVGSNLHTRFAGSIKTKALTTVARKNANFTGDLTDKAFIDKLPLKEIDTIFHCAAATSGGLSWRDPLIHIAPNIAMNVALLEAAYRAGVKKFIWLSSTTGYPECNYDVEEGEMKRGDPYPKYFAVGWMKRYTEKLCELYANHLERRMQCIVLRPTNIYGPGDKFDIERCHVLPAMINKIVNSKDGSIEVWGDGTEVRDLIYVDDMVDALIRAGDTDVPNVPYFDAYNIGSGTSITVNEMIEMIGLHEQKTPIINYIKGQPSMIPFRSVNIEKAKKTLMWEPKTSLAKGLVPTIKWYKDSLK